MCIVVFLLLPRPPSSTLIPYTTLFRSMRSAPAGVAVARSRTIAISSKAALSTCKFARPVGAVARPARSRSEEHTSELQSRFDLVCRLLLEKKKKYRLHSRYDVVECDKL